MVSHIWCGTYSGAHPVPVASATAGVCAVAGSSIYVGTGTAVGIYGIRSDERVCALHTYILRRGLLRLACCWPCTRHGCTFHCVFMKHLNLNIHARCCLVLGCVSTSGATVGPSLAFFAVAHRTLARWCGYASKGCETKLASSSAQMHAVQALDARRYSCSERDCAALCACLCSPRMWRA